MGRAKCTFKETDVRRAVKAAQAAGLDVSGVEVEPTGRIRVLTGPRTAVTVDPLKENSWANA